MTAFQPLVAQLAALTSSADPLSAGTAMLAIVVASYFWWRWALRPLHLRRQEEPLPGNEQRRVGRLPDPVYPSGWFRLCFSSDLPRQRPCTFPAFGGLLLAFRDEAGAAHVLDPYCPHLGANMVDGKVVGDCVECPFHGWRFNGASGRCTSIPYSDAPVPSSAAVEAWAVRERLGMVLVWYDVHKRPPQWEAPLVGEAGLWFHGLSEHRVGCHLQEMPENGADIAHLDYLHGAFIVPWLSPAEHLWTDVQWTPGGPHEPHLAHIRLTESFAVLGRAVPGTRVAVTITQIGLGMVQLSFATPLGRIIVVETVTPKGPLEQRAGHVVWAERWVPRWLAKLILRSLLIQFERDLPIWNKKTFLPAPLAVKGDGPLLAYRRWAAKLYPPRKLEAEAEQRAEAQPSPDAARGKRGPCAADGSAW